MLAYYVKQSTFVLCSSRFVLLEQILPGKAVIKRVACFEVEDLFYTLINVPINF